jgi:hypothetical protein
MGTSSGLLAKARGDLGTGDAPNKITRAYALRNGPAYLRAAWCMEGVTEWSRNSNNAKVMLPRGDRAYTVWYAEDFGEIKQWKSGTLENIRRYAKEGFPVLFDWGGTNEVGKIDHVGLIEKVLPDGRVQTIEANTGSPGAVKRRVRHHSDIAGFGVVHFTAPKPFVPTDKYPWTRVMRKGWYNSESVKKVQKRVNELGYKPRLVEDGDFGDNTTKGVIWVQKKFHIKADGEVYKETWAKLF